MLCTCVTISQDPCGRDMSYFVFSLNGIRLASHHLVGRWAWSGVWEFWRLRPPPLGSYQDRGTGEPLSSSFPSGIRTCSLSRLSGPSEAPLEATPAPSSVTLCRGVWPHSWSCVPLPCRGGPPQASIWPAWESLCREDHSLSESGTTSLNLSIPGRLRLCPS